MSDPKPVEKIELSEKYLGWRILFFILFVILAVSSFGSCINSLFSAETGWQEIEANSTTVNCSSDFVFMYYLGGSGVDATTENKALKLVYTEACEMAHKLFHNKETFEDVINVCYINQHPNEVLEVDAGLYEAFSVIEKYGNRNIYMAPVYGQYDEIFYVNDESELVNYDPYSSAEVAADYAEIATYANNPEMVDIQLLGDNKIKLHVSEEYLAYAEENYITDFIDFFWMKNAFVTDYLADYLIESGYTMGSLSSYDGFSRTLDTTENSYSFNIYDREEMTVYPAAVMQYSGTRSVVYLRDYMMSEMDLQHYYALSNGEVRTSYIDVADGFPKTAIDNLYSYSDELGCAEVLMQVIPVYVTEEFQTEAVAALAEAGIYSIYCEESVIKYNDASLVLTEILNEESVKYTTEFVE